jgi:hypothetical protein
LIRYHYRLFLLMTNNCMLMDLSESIGMWIQEACNRKLNFCSIYHIHATIPKWFIKWQKIFSLMGLHGKWV